MGPELWIYFVLELDHSKSVQRFFVAPGGGGRRGIAPVEPWLEECVIGVLLAALFRPGMEIENV